MYVDATPFQTILRFLCLLYYLYMLQNCYLLLLLCFMLCLWAFPSYRQHGCDWHHDASPRLLHASRIYGGALLDRFSISYVDTLANPADLPSLTDYSNI